MAKMTPKNKRNLKRLLQIVVAAKHLKRPQTFDELRTLPSAFPGFPIPFANVLGIDVFLDAKGYDAYKEFLGILVEDKSIAKVFAGSSISDIAKKHIKEYLEDAAQGHIKNLTPEEVLENILTELKTSPPQTEIYYLVNGFALDDLDSLSFGKATFIKIDESYADRFYPPIRFDKVKKFSLCRPLNRQEKKDVQLRRLQKKQALIGRTAIKVGEVGDMWRSRQEAYRECQITLGALSVYPIISTYESDKPFPFRFQLSGMTPQEFSMVYGFQQDTGKRSFAQGSPFQLPALRLKSAHFEMFKKYGWDDVSDFLKTRTEDREIDRQLEAALFWLYEAVAERQLPSALGKYFTAIESMIIGPSKTDQMVEKVASRLAVLVGDTPDEAQKLKNEVESGRGLYDLRSRVAHAGLSEIEDQRKVYKTGALAGWAFLNFLKARGFPTLDNAIAGLDKICEILFENKPPA